MPRHAAHTPSHRLPAPPWAAASCALALLLLALPGLARAADHGDTGHTKKAVVATKPVTDGAAAALPAKQGAKPDDKAAEKHTASASAAKPVAEPADGSLASRLKAAMADPKHAKGELVIPHRYSSADAFDEGRAEVEWEDEEGEDHSATIDRTGKVVEKDE